MYKYSLLLKLVLLLDVLSGAWLFQLNTRILINFDFHLIGFSTDGLNKWILLKGSTLEWSRAARPRAEFHVCDTGTLSLFLLPRGVESQSRSGTGKCLLGAELSITLH